MIIKVLFLATLSVLCAAVCTNTADNTFIITIICKWNKKQIDI